MDQYIHLLSEYGFKINPTEDEVQQYREAYQSKHAEIKLYGQGRNPLEKIFGDNDLVLKRVKREIGGLHVVTYTYDSGWFSPIYDVEVVLGNSNLVYHQKVKFSTLYERSFICEVWEWDKWTMGPLIPRLIHMKDGILASLACNEYLGC